MKTGRIRGEGSKCVEEKEEEEDEEEEEKDCFSFLLSAAISCRGNLRRLPQ